MQALRRVGGRGGRSFHDLPLQNSRVNLRGLRRCRRGTAGPPPQEEPRAGIQLGALARQATRIVSARRGFGLRSPPLRGLFKNSRPPNWSGLLVRDRHLVPVKLCEGDTELFVVALGSVLQDANSQRLTQSHRPIGVGAPVDAGEDAVTEADVARELVQFAAEGNLTGVGPGIGA